MMGAWPKRQDCQRTKYMGVRIENVDVREPENARKLAR